MGHVASNMSSGHLHARSKRPPGNVFGRGAAEVMAVAVFIPV